MKASKTLLRLLAAGTLLSGALIQPAIAAPINGNITFNGFATLDTNSLATATRVVSWSDTRVATASGSFSAIPLANPVTFSPNYIFNPSSPQTTLWTTSYGGTTFSFSLASSVIISQSASFLNIAGAGKMTGTGFDETSGVWSFTLSSQNGASSQTFRFGPEIIAVPDRGTTAACLGIACLGVWTLRRRFETAG